MGKMKIGIQLDDEIAPKRGDYALPLSVRRFDAIRSPRGLRA